MKKPASAVIKLDLDSRSISYTLQLFNQMHFYFKSLYDLLNSTNQIKTVIFRWCQSF